MRTLRVVKKKRTALPVEEWVPSWEIEADSSIFGKGSRYEREETDNAKKDCSRS